MRSSASEGPIAHRAKQVTPSASSGETAGPAGGPPTSQSRPNAPTQRAHQHKSNKSNVSSSNAPVAPIPATIKSPQTKSSSSKTPPRSATVDPANPKAAQSSSGKQPNQPNSQNQTNFGEYDDPEEWGVNVGHLIIDLDADIAQADKGKMSNTASQSASSNMSSNSEDKPILKMKIKRTKPSSKTSEAKHVIVKSDAPSSDVSQPNTTPATNTATSHHNGSTNPKGNDATGSPRTPSLPRSGYKKEKRRLDINGSSSPPPSSKGTSSAPPSPNTEVRSATGKLETSPTSQSASIESPQPSVAQSNPSSTTTAPPSSHKVCRSPDDHPSDVIPAAKKQRTADVEKKDMCVGTSVGTTTEPDCIGPCEPGSAVTLEGIVWHETQGGVLVVNVTWRGKTYVGTLLDCTQHDWAPPRLCDSPSSDLDSRTPKGRAKRGRAAAAGASLPTSASVPEVSVAETRSGKLRNAAKGRRGGGSSQFINNPSSPMKPDAGSLKRKTAKDHDISDGKNAKRSRASFGRGSHTSSMDCSSPNSDNSGQTSDNLEGSESQQPPTPSQPPVSPKLIECPEPNCGKKYTHINGLRYHQTHAHLPEPGENNKENCTPDSTRSSPVPVENIPNDTNKDAVKRSLIKDMVNGEDIDTETKEQVLNGHPAVSETRPTPNIETSLPSPVKLIQEAAITNNTVLPTNSIPEAPLENTQTHELKRSIGASKLPGSPVPAPKESRSVSPHSRTGAHSAPKHPTTPVSQTLSILTGQTLQASPIQNTPISPTTNPAISQLKSDSKNDESLKGSVLVGPGGRPLGQVENSSCLSLPLPQAQGILHGPPMSALPESIAPSLIDERTPGVGKEMASAFPPKISEPEMRADRDDATSPAYSDISDANDSVPVTDVDLDSKDEKKLDMPMGSFNPTNYGIYFGAYPQPPHPYLMSAIPPGSPTMPPNSETEPKEKIIVEKKPKDIIATAPSNEYLKMHPSYMYQFPQMYPNAFSDTFGRGTEGLYKDLLEKAKLESKDVHTEEATADKGPTDLSKHASQQNGTSVFNHLEKPPITPKEMKFDGLSIPKELQEPRGLPISDKRQSDNFHGYRFGMNPYENRVPLIMPSHDKQEVKHPALCKPPTPIPLVSPRLGPTPPGIPKEDKSDKRLDSKSEGVKPTMETTGPPPPPTSTNYFPQYPYPHPHPHPHVAFDYRQSMVPPMALQPGFGSPYLPGHPSLGGLRFPMNMPNGPEDLSRGASAANLLGAPGGLFSSAHKLAELQDRAQKSPSLPPVSMMQPSYLRNSSPSHHSVMHPSVSSPSFSNAHNIPSTTLASALHMPLTAAGPLSGERKGIPHHSLQEAFPYSLIPAPFTSHYAALGVNPGMPPMGPQGLPTSAMSASLPPK